MAFTTEEFRDIVRIIEQHPEWRAELRRLVLTEELLALPELVRGLAEAQKRTEERVGVFDERMAALAKAQETTSMYLGELAITMRETREQLTGMAKDLGGLKGLVLQHTYQHKAFAYFARIARRIQVLTGVELQNILNSAIDTGQLSEDEADELLWADVIARARSREESTEIFLVVEVSWGIGAYDVERAARRAGFLARTGVKAIPVVAGKTIDADSIERARSMQVRWVLDGQTSS